MKLKRLTCLLALASAATAQNFYDFDCAATGAVPAIGAAGNCEGVTGESAFIEGTPSCAGLPTTGPNCAVVRSEFPVVFLVGQANGGTIARPLPTGLPEMRLPVAAGTTHVGFDWRARFTESGGSYNDGLDISVCDAAGNRIELIVKADAATSGGFMCLGFNSLVHALAAPTPAGAYLSICAYDEDDNCCGGTWVAVDRVRFSAGNDECVGAMPINCTVYGQSNAGATTSPGIGCNAGADRWYAFTASRNGSYSFSTEGNANFDTVINVFSGCGGTLLGCNDDTLNSGQSTVPLSLTAGQTVYVSVGGWFGVAGAFNLHIVEPLGITFASPSAGSLNICIAGGTPNSIFFAPMTVTPGAFPNGTFFGLDISLFDLLTQIGAGAPFIGALDGNGVAQFGPYGPGLSGLTLYSVVLDDVGNPGFTASAPTSYTIP
jgi:hypothetical protein